MRIKIAGSRYVTVSEGYSDMPYINSSTLSAGNVRFNGSSKILEVYDGSMWYELRSSPFFVNLSNDAEQAIDWAQKKMQEETRIKALAEKYPAVKDAQERLQILLTLVNEQETKV